MHPDFLNGIPDLLFAKSIYNLQTFSSLLSSLFVAEIQLTSLTGGRGEIASRKGDTKMVHASKYIYFGCPGGFLGRWIQAFLVKSGQPAFVVKDDLCHCL